MCKLTRRKHPCEKLCVGICTQPVFAFVMSLSPAHVDRPSSSMQDLEICKIYYFNSLRKQSSNEKLGACSLLIGCRERSLELSVLWENKCKTFELMYSMDLGFAKYLNGHSSHRKAEPSLPRKASAHHSSNRSIHSDYKNPSTKVNLCCDRLPSAD